MQGDAQRGLQVLSQPKPALLRLLEGRCLPGSAVPGTPGPLEGTGPAPSTSAFIQLQSPVSTAAISCSTGHAGPGPHEEGSSSCRGKSTPPRPRAIHGIAGNCAATVLGGFDKGNQPFPRFLPLSRAADLGNEQCESGSRWEHVLVLCPHCKRALKPEPAAAVYFYCPP